MFEIKDEYDVTLASVVLNGNRLSLSVDTMDKAPFTVVVPWTSDTMKYTGQAVSYILNECMNYWKNGWRVSSSYVIEEILKVTDKDADDNEIAEPELKKRVEDGFKKLNVRSMICNYDEFNKNTGYSGIWNSLKG